MIVWGLLLVVAVLAIPVVVEARRAPMDDNARAAAPGAFTTLTQGKTHFQWHGPADGPVVVCVHGLSTPSFVWDSIAPVLAKAGYRILRYDLFGRGLSDRPGGQQNQAFFLQQLNDLLKDQVVTKKITIIGFSMGGIIATAFAAQHPKSVNRVILLAPAGMQMVRGRLFNAMLRLPVLGTLYLMQFYPDMLRAGFKAEADLPTSVPDITNRQNAELQWRGFVPALISSMRYILKTEMRTEHQTLLQNGTPVIAIWGADDTVIPLQAAQFLKDWNPKVHTLVIDGAGHGLPYTHTDDVCGALMTALKTPI